MADNSNMDKESMVKGGAVLFALMMFTKTNGALSNSEQALAASKKSNEQLTAISQHLGVADEPETGSAHGKTATEDASHGEEQTSAAAKKTTTTLKKTTTTLHKAEAKTTHGTTGKAAPTEHSAAGGSATTLHWSYQGEGGPEHWGELDKSYAACADGSKQSPIDVTSHKVADLPDLLFSYAPIAGSVVNNGHTVQVDLDAGNTVKIGEAVYALAQLHFHGPSEHTINGKNYPLEAHFVHKDAAGKLLVVGVLISEGDTNHAFDTLIANIPSEVDKPTAVTAIDVKSMLPGVQATYRYDGSLTTPPCSEGVAWNLMAAPITMSKAQIERITKHFTEPNNRPVQKLGTRQLVLDVSVALG